ncbi:MAG: nickel-dependent hydrogenase large subunit [Candidatus Wallbacteria bacterium]|nr:nickel-dependent hydrogenase large subunit [Candidatus Wallbacteria bacterium]
MKRNERIEVDYLARVEGETAIRIDLENEQPLLLKIFEPPRFFEGFLAGRKYDEVGDIVSRICGICPVSHMTTAILAIENAMAVEVSAQTKILRELMSLSQIAASHLIHLFMLAMPDYYGKDSITGLIPEFKSEVTMLLAMKEVLNGLTALIGGRALHAVTSLPGGFTKIPDNSALHEMLPKLKETAAQAVQVVKLVAKFNPPEFESKVVYAAISGKKGYAINDGRIITSDGLNIPVSDYLKHFQETQVDYANAKKTRVGKGSVTTGALPRMNLKFEKLKPETKKLAKSVGFSIPDFNPFHNNLAQALETYDAIMRCIDLIENTTFKDEDINLKIKAGEGGAITEAPRGLLYHWYRIDGRGVVEKANIVTPTAHNFVDIERSLNKLVLENKGRTRDQIRLLCEELVRAYDPCFSCSVH